MLVTSFSSLFSFVFLLLQLLVADPISFLGFNLEVCFSVATFSSVSDLYQVVQWRSGCLLLVSVYLAADVTYKQLYIATVKSSAGGGDTALWGGRSWVHFRWRHSSNSRVKISG
jgi:hypothetical protein